MVHDQKPNTSDASLPPNAAGSKPRRGNTLSNLIRRLSHRKKEKKKESHQMYMLAGGQGGSAFESEAAFDRDLEEAKARRIQSIIGRTKSCFALSNMAEKEGPALHYIDSCLKEGQRIKQGRLYLTNEFLLFQTTHYSNITLRVKIDYDQILYMSLKTMHPVFSLFTIEKKIEFQNIVGDQKKISKKIWKTWKEFLIKSLKYPQDAAEKQPPEDAASHKCGCKQHYASQCAKESVPNTTPYALARLLIIEGDNSFLDVVRMSHQTRLISNSEWKPDKDGRMNTTKLLSMPNFFEPSNTVRATCNIRILREGADAFVVQLRLRSSDMDFGQYFYTLVRICIFKEDRTATNVVVTFDPVIERQWLPVQIIREKVAKACNRWFGSMIESAKLKLAQENEPEPECAPHPQLEGFFAPIINNIVNQTNPDHLKITLWMISAAIAAHLIKPKILGWFSHAPMEELEHWLSHRDRYSNKVIDSMSKLYRALKFLQRRFNEINV